MHWLIQIAKAVFSSKSSEETWQTFVELPTYRTIRCEAEYHPFNPENRGSPKKDGGVIRTASVDIRNLVDYGTLVIRPNFYMTRFLHTIACLTGYRQDMCVATATHGPQARTLSLCSFLPPNVWQLELGGDKVVKRPYLCRANNRNLVLTGTAAVHLAQTYKSGLTSLRLTLLQHIPEYACV